MPNNRDTSTDTEKTDRKETPARPTEDTAPRTVEQGNATAHFDADHWHQIHQAHYDRESERELATALVFAISDAQGVDPLDSTAMPPLYESIDAEALESTFFGLSGANTEREETGEVTFQYNGLKIVLRSDGWIFVYEPK